MADERQQVLAVARVVAVAPTLGLLVQIWSVKEQELQWDPLL